MRELNELAKHGKDLGRLLSDLLSHFRNILIYQVSRGDLGLLEVSEAEAAALATQAKIAGADAITRVMEVLSECEMRLRDAASKKILIEVALLKAIEARQAMNLDAVLQQLLSLRNGGASSAAVPASSPAPSRPAVTTPAKAPPAAASSTTETAVPVMRESAPAAAPASGEELPTLWNRLVESVGRASPFTRTYLLEARPVSFKGNLFTMGFDPEFEDHMGLVDNARSTRCCKPSWPNWVTRACRSSL